MNCTTCEDTHQVVHPLNKELKRGDTYWMGACPNCGCKTCDGRGDRRWWRYEEDKDLPVELCSEICLDCGGSGEKHDK